MSRLLRCMAPSGAVRRWWPSFGWTMHPSDCARWCIHGAIVLDQTLPKIVDVAAGLRPDGWILVNSPEGATLPPAFQKFRLYTVDASGIAAGLGLGTRAMPMVNTAILGAVARIAGLAHLDHVLAAIPEIVSTKVEANLEAARLAFDRVRCPTPMGTTP